MYTTGSFICINLGSANFGRTTDTEGLSFQMCDHENSSWGSLTMVTAEGSVTALLTAPSIAFMLEWSRRALLGSYLNSLRDLESRLLLCLTLEGAQKKRALTHKSFPDLTIADIRKSTGK